MIKTKNYNINDYQKIEELMFDIKTMTQNDFWQKNFKRSLFFFAWKTMLKPIVERLSPYEIKKVKSGNYFSKKRIAIYTAIYGSYDSLKLPMFVPDNCDFFVYTDESSNVVSPWQIRELSDDFRLKHSFDGFDNVQKNRFLKMHPHHLFPEYEYSIYVDGNIQIMTDLTEFINIKSEYEYLKMFGHYRSSCVYNEMSRVLKMKKVNVNKVTLQKLKYISEGFPKKYGLLEACIIVRKHNDMKCINIMNEWWREFNELTRRDQLSLPYILWKNKINVKDIAILGNDIYSSYSFRKNLHNI